MKKIFSTIFFIHCLTLFGCDQIKNRLIGKKHDEIKSKVVSNKLKKSELLIKKNNLVNLKKNDNKFKEFQLNLLQENSKNNVYRDSLSIIGTEQGKPIRNINSKKTK